jgi:hypothetical protein
MIYSFNGNEFKTQKDAKQYIRSILNNIGICNSVKNVSVDFYEQLFNIVSNHPEADEKLKNIQDFCIKRNVLNPKGLELNIIKTDFTQIDVSWNICVSGKPKKSINVLSQCFRYVIDDQIQLFKQSVNINSCELCKKTITKSIDCHADHILLFKTIVQDFMKIHTFTFPTKFDEVKDGTNRYKLTKEDDELKNAFYKYHQDNATLRILCAQCNFRRLKT